jgi:hypothetical protein
VGYRPRKPRAAPAHGSACPEGRGFACLLAQLPAQLLAAAARERRSCDLAHVRNQVFFHHYPQAISAQGHATNRLPSYACAFSILISGCLPHAPPVVTNHALALAPLVAGANCFSWVGLMRTSSFRPSSSSPTARPARSLTFERGEFQFCSTHRRMRKSARRYRQAHEE